MAKEIQILNNGDALYDIRRKINENFEQIEEDVNNNYRFCVNQGNLTDSVEDLLYYNNNKTLDFKVGGIYRDLTATKADGTKFERISIDSRDVSNLSNGIYNVFLDEQDTELLNNTILSTGQEEVAQFNDILYDPLTFECKKCLQGGMSLTPATAYTTVPITGLAYGLNKYIAVGGSVNAVILTSIDGKNWSDMQYGGASPLSQIIYTGKSFVAVGNDATILRSTDGTNWTKIALNVNSYTGSLLSIATNGTRIIAGGSSSFTFYSDDDGLTWKSGTRLSDSALGYVRTIAYGDGIWVASSDTGHYYRSTDNGLTWEQRNLGISDNITRIRSLNRKFFALTNSGLVLQSGEGLNWTQYDTGENVPLTDISYFNNAYYCTSSSSTVFRTTDFQTWTKISTNVTNMNLAGAYQNILVGNPGKIYNIDGVTWQEYTKVPVGTVTISNGTIINVETFPYNRTQYNGLLATSTNYGLLRVAAETDETDCTCNDASITPSNLYDLANYRRANTQYNVDDKVGCPYHHNLQLKCTIAGTTSSEALDTRGIQAGDILEDGSVKWEVEELGTGGGLEIGDIGIAPLGIDETKGKRRYLNGQVIIQEQYLQFTNKVKLAMTLYPSLFTTEEQWQATATMTVDGQVGKFVVDDEAGTIRLPKIIMPIQGLTDLSKLGEIVEAGLPNIEGTLYPAGGEFANPFGAASKSDGAITLLNDGAQKTFGTSSGSYTCYNMGIDASLASPVYGKSETVQQEQIQYPYFIQVATGAETEDNIINEIELNNPFSLLDYKYSEYELNNLSWLRSEGQFNTKIVYPAVYDLLLKIYNGTETKAGVSVKLSTEAFTDYDFVLNTAEETFRLPVKVKLASGKAVVGNGNAIILSNGGYNSGIAENASNVLSSATGVVAGTPIGQSVSEYGAMANGLALGLATSGDTGVETSDSDLYLYFYVGETVQNANLINAGRIEEKLVDKVDKSNMVEAGSYIAGCAMPSNKYINLTLGASGATYTAPANGWFFISKSATGENFVSLFNSTVYMGIEMRVVRANEALVTYLPVRKGDKCIVSYDTSGITDAFRFIYAEGSESEAQ